MHCEGIVPGNVIASLLTSAIINSYKRDLKRVRPFHGSEGPSATAVELRYLSKLISSSREVEECEVVM